MGWRRPWHPTPVLLPGKSHGRRSLEGCSPCGSWRSDTTEWLHFHFSLSCIGEGNGNPLQCSCLENPRDREAWWAAVYGVAQSRRRLKWLSGSREMGRSRWIPLQSIGHLSSVGGWRPDRWQQHLPQCGGWRGHPEEVQPSHSGTSSVLVPLAGWLIVLRNLF